MNKGRRNSNERGNAAARRRRKLFLLTRDGVETPTGWTAPCWECARDVTFETMIVDRIVSGEDGGRYTRDNIRVHCIRCSGRQGQRRTTELTRKSSIVKSP